ncbi:MAG: hypothetical protein ACRD4O_02610 [Bryobacteraceae bacterium]
MRTGLLLLLTAGVAAAAVPSDANLDTILAKIQQRYERQRDALCGYTGTRVYTLHNSHLSHDTVMKYRVTMSRSSGKHFKLISEQHAGFLARHALTTLVDAEPDSRKQEQQGRLDRANYKFALLGEDVLNGHRCYVLHLSPRRQSKYLVSGKAWVDVESYAVRRIKGQLAKSVSFWVGKPEVEEDFANSGGFWMPSYNSSLSHVKLVGEATVTIRFSNYRFQRCGQ